MGGHGGLNILPQKRWNVYNFENREKVRKDEEEAARAEQEAQRKARERDGEFRLEKLRQIARSKRPISSSSAEVAVSVDKQQNPNVNFEVRVSSDEAERPGVSADEAERPGVSADEAQRPADLNIFKDLFEDVEPGQQERKDTKNVRNDTRKSKFDRPGEGRGKKRDLKGEKEKGQTVTCEDEKYSLGYGSFERSGKKPWYMSSTVMLPDEDKCKVTGTPPTFPSPSEKSKGKKTIEELRAERLKREQQERERAEKLVGSSRKPSQIKTRDFDGRRNHFDGRRSHFYYNSGYGNANAW